MIKFNLNFQLNRFPCQPRFALVRPSPLSSFFFARDSGENLRTAWAWAGGVGIPEIPGADGGRGAGESN